MNKELRNIIKVWRDCTRCPLGSAKTTHTHVFYRGSCPCDVLFIGEAPGKDEDLVGQPFVGRAGDVLDAWIEDSQQELCNYKNENGDGKTFHHNAARDSYKFGITNILCCLPLDEKGKIRPPTKAEAKECSPRLQATILAAKPRLIIILGGSARDYHKIPESLSHIPVVELQHPAFILRQGGIGSMTYDRNLLTLTDALEQYLYAPPKTSTKKDHGKPRKSRVETGKTKAEKTTKRLAEHTGKKNR